MYLSIIGSDFVALVQYILVVLLGKLTYQYTSEVIQLTISSDPPTAGTLERWRVRHCALCELSPLPSRRFLEPNNDGLSIIIIIIHRALRNV